MRKAVVAAFAVVLATTGTASAGVAVNVARRLGIAQTTRTFSVSTVDFDGDHRKDFFLVRHDPDDLGKHIPLSTLYRKVRGGFKNYASEMFGRTDKHGCDWGDANVDGRPDMFCTIGLTQRSINELWIQKRDGSFVNEAVARGLDFKHHGRGRYATFINANNDKWPDIYLTRYTGSCYCDRNEDGIVDYPGDDFPNELWINEEGHFRKAPEFGLNVPIGAKKDNATCAQAVDYDDDGDEDLLVCAWTSLHLYRNNDGNGFTDVTNAMGLDGNMVDARFVDLDGDHDKDFIRLAQHALYVRYAAAPGDLRPPLNVGEPPAPMALAFGDFNPGKKIDIYVMSTWIGRNKTDQPDRVFINRRHGVFEPMLIPGAPSGGGDDVAALDFNKDGQTDFVVTNGQRKRAGPVQMWMWKKGG